MLISIKKYLRNFSQVIVWNNILKNATINNSGNKGVTFII